MRNIIVITYDVYFKGHVEKSLHITNDLTHPSNIFITWKFGRNQP